jgi:uncharacterized protein YrzB (UPF0473 family)
MVDGQLSMIDEEGNEVLYDVLLSFDSDEFENSYVLIAPAGADTDDEDVEVLAYIYTEKEDGSIDELFPVETDEEWDMIEEVFNTRLGDEDEEEEDDEQEVSFTDPKSGVTDTFFVELTIESEEFGKSYVVVSHVDDEKDIRAFECTLNEDDSVGELSLIGTKEEVKMVSDVYTETLEEEGHSHHHHGDDHECCGGHDHDEDHECCGGHDHDEDHECCGGHDHDDKEEGHVCGCNHKD